MNRWSLAAQGPEPAIVALLCAALAQANVATGPIFGSHMVLQRGAPVPVFGTASNGENVTVTLAGQSKTTTAANGSWKVHLEAMTAGGPYTLTIKGANTVTYTDVMVGEVWHCAGQSNMDTRMNYSEYSFATDIAKANHPMLRYITMRQPNQTIRWQQVNPTSAGSMSATGYYFGRNLLESLSGVAVGIVNTSVGGTVIKTWLDPATVAATSDLAGDAEAGSMYKSWIKPVEGYGIKGSIYLQGENDASSSALTPAYNRRLEALIKGWRKAWNMPNMPFLVVGLCHKGGLQTVVGEASNQASVREAQRQVTDTMPHSLLSVAVDFGSTTTWHYPQKPQLGARIAAVARGWMHGQTGFVYLSPKPSGCYFRGAAIVIPWDTRGGKLALSGANTPAGFAVAGSDGKWAWATASLKGDTVFLTTSISKPTQLRYAWSNNPIGNLANAQGLPATPFQTTIASGPTVSIPTKNGRPLALGARMIGKTLVVPATGADADVFVVDAAGRPLLSLRNADLSSELRLRLPGSGLRTVIVKESDGSFRTDKIVSP